MNFLRQFIDGIREAWTQLSLSARVNLIMAGIGVAVLMAFFVFLAADEPFVTLSSGLTAQEAATVVQTLDENGITYRQRDGVAAIDVPVSELSSAQLVLAQSDLPVGRRDAPGLELFQDSPLITNDFLQNVQFVRALTGEVQRQLNAFDFVDSSYVLLREGRDELFVSDQQPSEAAVTLETNRMLTKDEVRAVVHIVSSAGGARLAPGNITVTTTDGQVLHEPPRSPFASIANSKLEYVAELEHERERRVMEALESMGRRGVVRVSAQVDFDEKEIEEDTISEGAELATLLQTTTVTSTEALPQGTPGAFANIEGAEASTGTSTSEETSEELINFEPSRTTTTTRVDPGDVIQYTVALFVEGNRETSPGPDGEDVTTYVGLSDDEVAFYENLIQGAVGQGREVTLATVNDIPFEISDLTAATAQIQAFEATRSRDLLLDYAWNVGQLLAILLGFLFVWMLLRAAIESPTVEEEEEEVAELPEATREDLRRQEVAREVGRLAMENPGLLAALLRTWLNEEDDQP